MKKYLLIISMTILLPFLSVAQNFEDALRYSNFKLEGTARAGAMGNAFGSLGGDFTGVGINPAGLGIYRSSEFSLTPNFGMNKVEATYLDGDNMSDNSLKFRMNNGSYVAALHNNKTSQSGLVSINFGIGFNRLRDYNSYAVVNGTNAQSSFLDHLTENANKGIWSDYYEEVASKADVLLYDNNLKEYWNDIREAGYGQDQRKSYQRSGALDEYTLALGLNFDHKLYLGASLGIIDLYYKENTTLLEEDANDEIDFFDYFKFRTSLRTFGTGYNFKIGVIYKPVNNIRLGASLASPTYYNLHDNFDTDMASSITEGSATNTFHPYSPILEYDYDLMTPFKATLSGALIIGKKGLISGDVEIVDYTIMKLRNGGDGYDFLDENEDINDIYKSVANFRVGGEYKVSDPFALRAGFEFYPSVFNSTAFGEEQPNADVNYSIISAGFGYKSGGFFLDAAYRLSAFTDYAQLYPAPKTADYPKPAMAKFDTTNGKLLLTLGFRF